MTIHTIFSPNLHAAGAHLAARTLSMLLSKGDFMNFRCEWSETPRFMNDSWQITVAEDVVPLNIATNDSGALIEPCKISMYQAKPIRKIEVFCYTNLPDGETEEETVNYDQAILFSCEDDRAFCIGCSLNGPGVADYLHFSEDPEVIRSITEGSSIRQTLN
jgi:hypothetical protein